MNDDARDAKPEKPEADQWSTIELSKQARATCGILGVASVIYAGIVLWDGKEGAATVAFVVLGAILIILGLSGVLPRRIKSGDHELEIMRKQVLKGTEVTTDNAIAAMTRPEIESFINETLRSRESGDSGQNYVVIRRATQALDFTDQVAEWFKRNAEILEHEKQGPYDFSFALRDLRVNVEVAWKLSRVTLEQVMSFSQLPHTIWWIVLGSFTAFEMSEIQATLTQPSEYQVKRQLLV